MNGKKKKPSTVMNTKTNKYLRNVCGDERKNKQVLTQC